MATKESSWEIIGQKSRPKLTEALRADVVILGGGITGIFNAYILARAGLSVVLLEKEEKLSQHATMLTTAFITKVIDTPFDVMSRIYGQDNATAVWQSGQEAILLIADIIRKETINCEFKFVPAYTYAKNDRQFKKLSKEYTAVLAAGFQAVLHQPSGALPFLSAGFMEIPAQAKFHPIKFAEGLAAAAEGLGARIFTDSAMVSLEGSLVKTAAGEVLASDVVIATHRPFTNEGTSFKKAVYVSYVYDLEIPKNLMNEGMYLDMQNPYHYFRIDQERDFDRMIVGGQDHRADIKIHPGKNFNALERYVQNILGKNAYTVRHLWRGPILESIDGLPYIGAIKPHLYVATAFSGNGMTYSAVSATIIRDSIQNKKNPYTDIYKLKRIPTLRQLMVKGGDYMGELFGGAVKNFFLPKI